MIVGNLASPFLDSFLRKYFWSCRKLTFRYNFVKTCRLCFLSITTVYKNSFCPKKQKYCLVHFLFRSSTQSSLFYKKVLWKILMTSSIKYVVQSLRGLFWPYCWSNYSRKQSGLQRKPKKKRVWVLICRINVKCAPFCRNSHPEALYKKHVLKISQNFTGKHLCWSLFCSVQLY